MVLEFSIGCIGLSHWGVEGIGLGFRVYRVESLGVEGIGCIGLSHWGSMV